MERRHMFKMFNGCPITLFYIRKTVVNTYFDNATCMNFFKKYSLSLWPNNERFRNCISFNVIDRKTDGMLSVVISESREKVQVNTVNEKFSYIKLVNGRRKGIYTIIIIYCWSSTTIAKEKKKYKTSQFRSIIFYKTLSVNFVCVYTIKKRNI